MNEQEFKHSNPNTKAKTKTKMKTLRMDETLYSFFEERPDLCFSKLCTSALENLRLNILKKEHYERECRKIREAQEKLEQKREYYDKRVANMTTFTTI